jgi:nucleosome binding factor SPN SPT16 subunit
MKAHQKDLMA